MSLKSLFLRLEHLVLKLVPGLITCAEADQFIDDYLDGRLAPQVHKRFERHLGLCRPCRSYLEAYRRSVALARASGEDAEAPEMPEELRQAILAARDRARD